MLTIYYNPACSKCRQTLALLHERALEPTVVRYLERSLDEAEINRLIDRLGIEPHALLRTKEAAYREAGLSSSSSRDAIVSAIAAHPILLERPIVVHGTRAVICRPPENVLSLL